MLFTFLSAKDTHLALDSPWQHQADVLGDEVRCTQGDIHGRRQRLVDGAAATEIAPLVLHLKVQIDDSFRG